MSAPVFWAAGQWIDALALPNRGADFGDGLFETLRVVAGRALLLDYHLDRAMDGASRLALPVKREQLRDEMMAAVAACPFEHAALRMTITRAATGRGYRFDQNQAPTIWFSFSDLAGDDGRQMRAPAHLELADYRLATQAALAGIKHMNRLDQVLAAGEAQQRGVDELLMCDQDGVPVSVIAGNIFALTDQGQWQTPTIERAGVAGTVRRAILERSDSVEVAMTLADILKAQEVFYCNSLIGLRPVARLGDQQWRQWPQTQQVFRDYLERVLA